ncbi:hypothetical protein E3N88_07541 [Mikania micrantha]|uniref:Uncharacterized protein n=1 Tax=Mikania micrantha TaxID=192012 RepID=A0A5N6PTW9_9ASTR|nr:hypothetical protein E3N88_07541 [Mikania micrantha]
MREIVNVVKTVRITEFRIFRNRKTKKNSKISKSEDPRVLYRYKPTVKNSGYDEDNGPDDVNECQPLTVKFLRRMIDVMMSCDADCQPRMNGCHELNVMYELRRKCKVRKIVSVMHVEEMGWETFRTYELGKWLITPDQRH